MPKSQRNYAAFYIATWVQASENLQQWGAWSDDGVNVTLYTSRSKCADRLRALPERFGVTTCVISEALKNHIEKCGGAISMPVSYFDASGVLDTIDYMPPTALAGRTRVMRLRRTEKD